MYTKEFSQKFQTPDWSKEKIRKPAIVKLLGDIKGKKILEIGCGTGYWTRFFAKKGANCTGIDSNKNQLNLAKEKNTQKIKYLEMNATNLKELKPNSFDIVFLEYVLLEIPTLAKIKKIFAEINRSLKKNGILLISDMHPFDPFIHKDRFEYPKEFNYYSSGETFKAKALQINNKWIKYSDYHWTIQDYSEAFSQTGFVISNIKEPQPSKETIKKIPYLKYRNKFPRDIMILAKKN
jgi:ubiquinone/menaquinone biosynthesis C-methylase UbiE